MVANFGELLGRESKKRPEPLHERQRKGLSISSACQKVGPKIYEGRYHSFVHLASDYIHSTPRGRKCHIRIYLPQDERDAPVVICSEVPGNEGSSVTYSAHQIAAEVIRYHRLSKPVWIEHYPKEATDTQRPPSCGGVLELRGEGEGTLSGGDETHLKRAGLEDA